MNKQFRKTEMRLTWSGYGHYKVEMKYMGKTISCVTNNMPAVDDYNSDMSEREGRRLRYLIGYRSLRNECIRKNNLDYKRK